MLVRVGVGVRDGRRVREGVNVRDGVVDGLRVTWRAVGVREPVAVAALVAGFTVGVGEAGLVDVAV